MKIDSDSAPCMAGLDARSNCMFMTVATVMGKSNGGHGKKMTVYMEGATIL